MNKIFKSFFNKRKKCYVVASEKCSVTRKGSAKTIALIIPIVALASPQSAYSVTFGGYVNHTNGVYEDADGNKLLNLQKLEVANGPTVGNGSIGAGQDAVSFGAGRFWKPLVTYQTLKFSF